MKMEISRRNKNLNHVTLNVGGTLFKTTWATLGRIQDTRLSKLADLREKDESYIPEHNEFYFDRNPVAFQCIIEYYRTTELHMNESLCGNTMKKELAFWELFETEIEACCWGSYSKYLDHKEVLANLDNTFSGERLKGSQMKSLSRLKKFQIQVWNHLEYPSTSRGAKVLMVISLAVVLTSILTFVCESHYQFQVLSNDSSIAAPNPELYYGSTNKNCYGVTSEFMGQTYPETDPVIALTYIDYGCVAFFLVELLIRFTFAPDKCEFMKGILNIIDVICIVPQLVSIALERGNYSKYANAAGDILRVISVLRMIRVLRIFKLMKHYSAFKVLAYTIKVSTKELLLMVVFLLSGVMVFASLVYFFEKDNFYSIPYAIWWALVTMTTVGYGDVVPKTSMGYMVGCLCVIGGVLVIAFTVPVVVNNFTLYYSHANSRAKLPLHKRRNLTKYKNHMAIRPIARRDCPQRSETSMSTISIEDNISQQCYPSMNILSEEPKKPTKDTKLSFSQVVVDDSSSLDKHTSSTPSLKHEAEARALVDNLKERNRDLLYEKRRQYMKVYERMKEKRKSSHPADLPTPIAIPYASSITDLTTY